MTLVTRRERLLATNCQAIATDYDGTLASNGIVLPGTLTALVRVRLSNRKLVLVTGRELGSLLQVLPQLGLFDRVVVENGAVLYRPAGRTAVALAPPPPPAFVKRLQEEDVLPLSAGTSVVATLLVHQETVSSVIQDMGLDLEISLNRESMMILPAGINKRTGLQAALEELAIPFSEVVGIGDAENDVVFLERCGCSVAVANALPVVTAMADVVTRGFEGAGVAESIDRLLGVAPPRRRKAQRQPC